MTTESTPNWSRVRTFKPRRRSLSANRQRRFDALAPLWTIDVNPTTNPVDPSAAAGRGIEPSTYFGDRRPVVLDIGIGIGESCIEMATADPSTNVIGVDVHTPGIANALSAIDDRGLSNLRLVHGDVFDLLDRLAPGSLDGVRVFFPDPWPKPRHQRRRLINDERLPVLVNSLAPGGWLHLATDSADYAEQMRQVCERHSGLDGGVIGRPGSRPVTRFERRGVDAGRPIVDLLYERSRRD